MDYRLSCETNEGSQLILDAKFYVADIHNNPEKLASIVQRAQLYKML